MRPRLAVVSLLIVIVANAAGAAENVLASNPPRLRTGDGWSIFLLTGDFDGDGKPDAVTHPFGQLVFHRGLGDGTFAAPVVSTVDINYENQLEAADLNGDGKLDVVALTDQATAVVAFVNGGAGSFVESSRISLADGPSGRFATADFNGDGKADVVMAGNGRIIFIPGTGSGGLGTPITTTAAGAYNNAVAGDVNHDGKMDVVFAGGWTGPLFTGNGDGTFTALGSVTTGDAVQLGDLNGDGFADAVGARETGNIVSISFGSAAGFGAAQQVQMLFDVEDLFITDMDGDGHADIVMDVESNPQLAILPGRGDGTFGTMRSFLVNAWRAGIGDYDGDGTNDVLALDYGEDGILVLVHGNGDGSLDAPESYDVYSQLSCCAIGATGIHLGDVTGDGKLDAVTLRQTGYASSTAIAVFPGDGAGRFGAQILTTTGDWSLRGGWMLVDANRDGRLDVLYPSEQGARLFAGNGDGKFTAGATSATTGAPFQLADFTNDGIPDLLTGSFYASIYPGRGDGTYSAATTVINGDAVYGGWQFADVNGDGNLDLTEAHGAVYLGDGTGKMSQLHWSDLNSGNGLGVFDATGDGIADLVNGEYGGGLRIRAGRGDGTFTYNRTFGFNVIANYSPNLPPSRWVDVDGDGNRDLVIGTWILLGAGDGTFPGYQSFHSGSQPIALDTADLDGNGTLDLVALSFGGSMDVFLTGRATSRDIPTSIEVTAESSSIRWHSWPRITATVTADSPYKLGGAVSFAVDGQAVGIEAIDDNGQAKIAVYYPWLDTGTHTVTATFLRNETFASSAASLQETVTKGAVSLLVWSSKNPSPYSQPLTIYVSSAYPRDDENAAGTYTLTIDGTTVKTFSVADLQKDYFAFKAPALAVGTHTIALAFSGNTNVDPATFSYQHVISKALVSASFASTNPAVAGQPAPLTVDLVYGNGTPSGTFTLTLDGKVVKTFTAAEDPATYTPVSLSAGMHTYALSYPGDANYDARTLSYPQSVTKAQVQVAFSSINPATYGKPLTVTITETHNSIAPAGTFTLSLDGKVVKTFTAAATPLQYSASGLKVGKHTFSVSYPGDANYQSGTFTYEQTIAKPVPVIRLTVRPLTTDTKTKVTMTATLSPSSATGKVTFYSGTTRLGAATISRGKATLALRFPKPGTYLLHAQYGGDATYGTATSSEVKLTVKPGS